MQSSRSWNSSARACTSSWSSASRAASCATCSSPNILTRRIHDLYVRKTEQYLATHQPQDKPKQLIITIEEAHKFLNPVAARQTIFGTIAREMRKYFVSLLIVDQRPSSIDDEILFAGRHPHHRAVE